MQCGVNATSWFVFQRRGAGANFTDVERLRFAVWAFYLNKTLSRVRVGTLPADTRACRRTIVPASSSGLPSMSAVSDPVEHVFTVDVEEYFHVGAFEGIVSRKDWSSYPSRIDSSIDLLIDLLARHGATGTFFTLGWVRYHNPRLVRRIAQAGHEIASHGYWHRRVDSARRGIFGKTSARLRRYSENVCGSVVWGFRAPNFWIRPGCEWAFDVLLEEGFR